jgi:hypothetical protein
MMDRARPTALVAFLGLLACAGAYAQQPPASAPQCDPLIDVAATRPDSYKERGDRCEGVYEQKVSGGTGLRVASLTDSSPRFDLAPGDAVHLSWATDGSASVRLRALSLRFHHYYRMDSTRPAGTSAWVWPADVLGQHKLTSREIGVVGIVRRQFADGARDVFVPIRMAKNAAPPPGRPYTLVVRPDANLRQLFLTVSRLKADGTPDVALTADEDLKQGPYPARAGVAVHLPPLPKPGYYSVELAGVTESSQPVTLELTFYHGG